MPMSAIKIRLTMAVCLSGFELCSRWVPLGFARHLKIAHCRTYVLQLRRNKLKCGFYRQNPAYCSRTYLIILHK